MSAFRFAKHQRLFFADWSILDPRVLDVDEEDDSVTGRVHHLLFPIGSKSPESVTISRADARALKDAADAYHHLTRHPAGAESTVRQLRDIRRALRLLDGESR